MMGFASSLFAQEPKPAPQTIEYFSLYNFHLVGTSLGSSDPRFSWDAHFGADVDALDYVVGRMSFLMDYEAVMGSQLRPFDPNQGNYTLEGSLSYRLGGVEVATMFHHVSRHLGDRAKDFAIAWNLLGVRALKQSMFGSTVVNTTADFGWIGQRSYVDYQWIGNAAVDVRHPAWQHAVVYGRGSGQLVGINSSVSTRPTQAGGVAEGGVRLGGTDGVIELFAGVERRIDADPLDFQPQQWMTVGFRLLRR
jgi:hypothetical protein